MHKLLAEEQEYEYLNGKYYFLQQDQSNLQYFYLRETSKEQCEWQINYRKNKDKSNKLRLVKNEP